ncbi:hypothetical protein [Stenotrophomonas sp. MMGLT7]|uniref:hypothetical protein n=1 Tax=Stenotrophomonas sp. MMGLT7 TaxID=2901227 RepID=UPI001E5A91B2|nr:hypothetical protein [Stenotrophomonas sp. MMGLT7]MCD7096930.1 hypothetical protein [Stenotrophomonas sp. MMGLT7]
MQHLMVQPHPLAPPVAVEVPAGLTLRQMLQQAAGNRPLRDGLVVQVNGEPVPEEWWDRLHPRPQARILVSAPTATNGGNTRAILAAVAMIVVSIYAPQLGAYLSTTAIGGSAKLWTAGIMLASTLAVSALVAPHSAASSSTSGQSWRSLTGTQNAYNQWGVIPCVVGQTRIYPPHASLPYSEQVGEKSYHYYLFELGHGDLECSDIRIGSTSIDEFDEVTYAVTRTPTIYQNDVDEQAVSLTMDDEGDTNVRTTSPRTQRITAVLLYPGGLYGQGTSGKKFQLNTIWSIKYRPTGTETWLDIPSPSLSGLRAYGSYYSADALNENAVSFGIAWDVDEGQYDVQVTRVTNSRGGSANTYIDSAMWSVLRSVRMVEPTTTGTNKLEMRILATDKLSGTIDSLSLLVGQKIKTYDADAGTWTEPAVVTNTAWVVYWLLTECPALVKHAASSRMKLDNWVAYAEFCARHGLEARDVLDSSSTVLDYARKLLAASMADLGFDTHYYAVYDDFDDDSVPSWTFLPLEVKSFKAVRTFTELPQALRVQFVNSAADYIDDEVIVLADGYSYRGVDARGNPSSAPEPTRYETLQMEVACIPQQAWAYGRFHHAQARYRPESISFDSDIAGYGAKRGNLVYVGHDTVEWGVGFGAIERFAFASWAALAGMTGKLGQRVPVLGDKGTHTDPVSGAQVDNAGIYAYASAGWRRVRDLSPGEAGATLPAGTQAVVWLNNEIETEAGIAYKLQVRNGAGRLESIGCIPHSTRSRAFYLSALPTGLAIGYYTALGTAGNEVARVLLTGRTHGSNLSTAFTGVRYDSRVRPYWMNPPDSIISEVSGTEYGVPAAPEVLSIVSNTTSDDSDDAGIRTATVRVSVRSSSGFVAMEAA